MQLREEKEKYAMECIFSGQGREGGVLVSLHAISSHNKRQSGRTLSVRRSKGAVRQDLGALLWCGASRASH